MKPHLILLGIEIILSVLILMGILFYKKAYREYSPLVSMSFAVTLVPVIIYILLQCYILICSYSLYQDLMESNRPLGPLPTNIYPIIGSVDNNMKSASYEINNENMP